MHTLDMLMLEGALRMVFWRYVRCLTRFDFFIGDDIA